MKLIIMPSKHGQYAPITLSVSRLVMLVGLLLVAALMAGAVLQRLVWKLQPETQPSALVVAAMVPVPAVAGSTDSQAVQLLATKVGELQATIKRLDGLGQRVAKVAGLPEGDIGIGPPGHIHVHFLNLKASLMRCKRVSRAKAIIFQCLILLSLSGLPVLRVYRQQCRLNPIPTLVPLMAGDVIRLMGR